MDLRTMRAPALLLALTTLALPGRAHAQDEVLRREAQLRFQEGTTLLVAGKFEDARAKFLQAYSTGKTAHVTFNLARTEQLTGRHLDAAKHFREYLADPNKRISAEDRERARGLLQQVEPHIGRIAVHAPDGAHLTVDGQRIDDAPLSEPLDVAPGMHVVAAEWGARKQSLEVNAAAGHLADATFALEPPVSMPPPAVASTSATVPIFDEPPPAVPERTKSTLRYVVPIGLGVAALGAAAGAYAFDRAGRSAADEAHSYVGTGACAPGNAACSRVNALVNESRRDATWSNVFLASAGVLGTGAIVTWLVWPSAEPRARGSARTAGHETSPRSTCEAHIVPLAAPSTLGASYDVRF